MLTLAAALIFALGLAHSLLGERYILVRLFRRPDLPQLFGGTAFTTATLRFAWHLTTLAWWGFAVILLHIEYGTLSTPRLLQVIAVTTFVSGLLPLFFTRGRHLSWIVFFTVAAVLAIAATRA
jgi:hypothetical protein